jgi:uncharacterized protein YdhG (YjbR/CyaY superfamily)
MNKPHNFKDYFDNFPVETQLLLTEMQRIIKKNAPEATEIISYSMPAFQYFGMLVYFAAYKNHIGFYPMPSAISKFKGDLYQFKGAKGSVQFPLDQPLPIDLIGRIIKFRIEENLEKFESKKNKS